MRRGLFLYTLFLCFKELFGDVGGMLESRLVRPGTAEVIYKTVEDAKRAVDLYHNRQLDGQPMNCLLVAPRPTSNMAKYEIFLLIHRNIGIFHLVKNIFISTKATNNNNYIFILSFIFLGAAQNLH